MFFATMSSTLYIFQSLLMLSWKKKKWGNQNFTTNQKRTLPLPAEYLRQFRLVAFSV